jgi:hypothetical protein
MHLAKVMAITDFFQELLRIAIQEYSKILNYGELQNAQNKTNNCFLVCKVMVIRDFFR